MMAVRASARARRLAATAVAAPVRRMVISIESITASGEPLSPSHSRINPWMLGRPKRVALWGKFPLHLTANHVRSSLSPAALMWKPPSVAGTPSTPGPSVRPPACRRKASSTVAMQSSMVSRAATSRRVRTSVPAGAASPEKVLKASSRLHLQWRNALSEDARGRASLEHDRALLDQQHRPLAQAHDRRVVLLVVLEDPLFLGFPHVGRSGVGVQI